MRFKVLLLPPFVVLLVWALAVWFPSRSAVSTADERLDRAQAEQLSLVAEIDSLNRAAEQLPELEASLVNIAEAIPAVPDVDGFLAVLAAAAERNNVRVTLVSPNEILTSGANDLGRSVPLDITAIALVIEAQGGFENVMAFTQELGELSRLVVVDRLGMSSVDGDVDAIVIDMGLRIFTGVVGNAGTSTTLEPAIDAAFDAQFNAAFDELTVLDGGGREREESP